MQSLAAHGGSRKSGRERAIVSAEAPLLHKRQYLEMEDNDCVGLLFGFPFHTEPADKDQAEQNNLKLS